jgi:hypothetical protein
MGNWYSPIQVGLYKIVQRPQETVEHDPPPCTLAETKIGRLVYSNSPPGGTVVIRILRFFCTFISFISALSQI